MKKNNDWIVFDLMTHEGVCTRCGARELPELPMPVRALVAWIKYFTEKHKNCKEQA